MLSKGINRLRFALWVALVALLSALYCQYQLGWLPCPLCVMQRVGLVLVLLSGVVGVVAGRMNKAAGFWMGSVGVAMGGLLTVAAAGRHLWVLAHPSVSCGIDPLETAINANYLVNLFPWLLQADGLCTTPYPSVLGLPLPAWGLISGLIPVLTVLSLTRARRG